MRTGTEPSLSKNNLKPEAVTWCLQVAGYGG